MIETIQVAEQLEGAARIGILQADDLSVKESSEDLKTMLNALVETYAAHYKNQSLSEIETVRAIRRIFHRTGLDPTRYRPSSESLLRRAVKGKGLYFINSIVDLVNYFSLKTLWPIGLYDVDNLKPPITWRIGEEGETYTGIGRNELNLARFPLLVDRTGPFGSPISDSMRTRVTMDSTRILWITFAPPGSNIPLDEFAEAIIRFNGGKLQVSTAI